jgi:hypothetical protein
MGKVCWDLKMGQSVGIKTYLHISEKKSRQGVIVHVDVCLNINCTVHYFIHKEVEIESFVFLGLKKPKVEYSYL